MINWEVFLLGVLILSSPLVLAAMGGYLSERSGVMQIGLEGMMLFSACVCALASFHLGPVGGIAAGVGAAVALALLHWVATQIYGIDAIVSGMAVNAFAFGGGNFFYGRFGDPGRGEIPQISIFIFFGLALILPVLLGWVARDTAWGLRLRSVGADPERARLAGIKPMAVRLQALVGCGIMCGLAGALLVTDTGFYTDGMTAGRGFIALAALILGGWRPIPTALACLVFGALSALRIGVQGTEIAGATLPTQLWAALPYLFTIIALAGFSVKGRVPAGMGKA